MAKTTLYLVWNKAKSECVGFLDEGDADYTATGDAHYLETYYMTPTIGDDFRDNYGDQMERLPQSVVEIDN